MKVAHTPGPWAAISDRTVDGAPFTVIVGGHGSKSEVLICEAPNSAFYPVSYKAFSQNGSLISAAPDLLAALKDLASSTEFWEQYPEDHPYGKARIAIAKAEGELA